jgi:Predicted integral membrane protein
MLDLNKSNWKAQYKFLGYIIAAVIIVFLLKDFIYRWNEIKYYVFNINIRLLIFSLVSYIAFYNFLALGWIIIIRKFQYGLSLSSLFEIYFKSQFAKYLPGGLWNNVGRFYLCKNNGVDSKNVITSLILENLLNVVASVIILISMLSLFKIQLIKISFPLLVLGLLILIIILHPKVFSKLFKLIGRFFKKDVAIENYDFSFILLMLAYYIFSWVLFGISFGIMICSFTKVTFNQFLFSIVSFPASWVFGFLSPSPGGLGVREGILVFLLNNFFSNQLSVYISVISRLWITVGEVITFFAFLTFRFIKERMRIINFKFR